MNVIAATILWMSVQIALFSFVGVLAFVLLRRRGPNTAAACCATVLGLTLPLAMMVVCPWPRWSLTGARKAPVSDRGVNAEGAAGTIVAADQKHDLSMPPVSAASDASVSPFAIWWQTAVDWVRYGDEMQSTGAASRSNWQSYLPWLMAAGLGYCMLRTVAGLWAMSQLRRNSRPISDVGLQSAVSEIIEKIDNTQSPAHPLTPSPAHPRPTRSGYVPEVRETTDLRSAATIGWRRPVLLLPADWRSWTETERRVVLAHELAHVAQRDYLTGVIARIATSIHFYQPLVLWLSRQLRIQQELAADSHAAAIAGSRQTYLTTLAQMALRADDQPLPWAARAFLPGTSMLIKRVAWLKQKGDQNEMAMNRKTRTILLVAMVAVAICVSGIRGPTTSNSAIAQSAPPVPAQPKAGQGTLTVSDFKINQFHTPDFVPADAKLVIVVSPAELAKTPSVAKLISVADQQGFENKFGLKLSELADVQAVKTTDSPLFDKFGGPQFERIIVRAGKPHDWKKTILRLSEGRNAAPLATKQLGGKEYFVGDPAAQCVYVPDDRTLIIGTEEEIQKIIRGGEKLMSKDEFLSLGSYEFGARFEMPSLRSMIGLDNAGPEADEKTALIKPLFDQVKMTTLSGAIVAEHGKDEKAVLGLAAQCASEEGAKQVEATLNAVKVLTQNLLSAHVKAFAAARDIPAPDAKLKVEVMSTVMGIAQNALENTKIRSGGVWVNAESAFNLPAEAAMAFIQPAIVSAREAAMRTQSMNNMKQIALAMWNYESVKMHLPPAAIRDKDGKPLLSWRVALLPYLEEGNAAFHLDEPWDSEHNKALISKMPAVFRDPHEDAKSTNASYFMPTGVGTIGADKEGTPLKDVVDGTSKTILLIEAKRDIPWTKPEDIEINTDDTKPLPKFGGHWLEGYFGAAFADGHIEVISTEMDPKVLKAMFTIAGHEPLP